MTRIFTAIFYLLLAAVPAAAQNHEPLPETFVSEDEHLTLRYPSGWVIQDSGDGQVLVGTNEDVFTTADTDLPSGQAAIVLLFVAGEVFADAEIVISNDLTGSLTRFMETLNGSGIEEISFSPAYETTFGVNPAARADGTVDNNDVFVMLVYYGDDTFSIFVGLTAGGEMQKYEPKLLAIAESVNYAPE
jgi:hypothetical protein